MWNTTSELGSEADLWDTYKWNNHTKSNCNMENVQVYDCVTFKECPHDTLEENSKRQNIVQNVSALWVRVFFYIKNMT